MIIVVDGRSGSGKTTYAAQLVAPGGPAEGARVLHLEDLYAGWGGLAFGVAQAERILAAFATGDPVHYREWDWVAYRWGAERTLEPGGALVVEGCGALTPATAALANEAVWLDAPAHARLARIRDRGHGVWWWDAWAAQEAWQMGRHDPAALATRVIRTG